MTKQRRQAILTIAILALVAFAALLVLGGCRDEARVVRERIAINANADSYVRNGYDIIMYSDDRSTQKLALEGSAGNVDAEGTLEVAGNTTLSGALSLGGALSTPVGAITFTDNLLIDGAADAVQLTVQGYTTQTSGLLVLEQSDGTDKFTVSNAGNTVVGGTFNSVGNADLDGTLNVDGAISDAGSAVTIADNAIVDGAADAVQLTVQGYTTQTNAIFVVENSGGTDQLTVANNGDVTATGDVIHSLFGRFTAQASITVTDGVGFIPTGTYQPITAAGAVTPTITATVAGDIVILVNESAVAILLQDTGIQMFNTDRTLNQYDVLVLLCDGTNWLELSYTDN